MKFQKVQGFYGRFERPISSLSLIGGFLFDIFTLERIDRVWDNAWVLGHILIVAIFMVLVHSKNHGEGDEADPHKLQFWYVNILQFFFGGLLSVFLVFYFRSGDLAYSWPFLSILAIAFWANESMKRNYVRLTFQVSLFFLSVLSCAIFLVPVLIHQIGSGAFIMAGFASILILVLFLRAIYGVNPKKFQKSFHFIWISSASIFVGVNFLYFTNFIPPIPLSLKESGVYYLIQSDAKGDYFGLEEKKEKTFLYHLYKDVKIIPKYSIYAYSAVFSPTSLDTKIAHEWQYYDTTYKEWVRTNLIELNIFGGRDEGFRTYSVKADVFPGKWRVRVKTISGQVIGTIRFNLIDSATAPVLENEVLQ